MQLSLSPEPVMSLELSNDLFSQTGPFESCPWNTLNKLALTREFLDAALIPCVLIGSRLRSLTGFPAEQAQGLSVPASLWSEAHAKVDAPS